PTQENQTPRLDDTNEDDLKNRQKSELITDPNGQIEEMQKFIYNQGIEIEKLRGKLDDQENEIEELRTEIQDLCNEKIKHNEMLVEQWNS
ncbi:23177_t:CDS:2, partial [Gigaspora margarita]